MRLTATASGGANFPPDPRPPPVGRARGLPMPVSAIIFAPQGRRHGATGEASEPASERIPWTPGARPARPGRGGGIADSSTGFAAGWTILTSEEGPPVNVEMENCRGVDGTGSEDLA